MPSGAWAHFSAHCARGLCAVARRLGFDWGGAGIAKYRTEDVSSPVFRFRYYGAIEGRIINIDRSGSDAVRLTLDRVILNRMSPNRTPSKVRVSVHDDGRSAPYRPGDSIMTTGHLSPPSGPAELGGFDFQRHAWFLQIGAVGYTRNPVVRIAVADDYDGWRLWIFQRRRTLAKAVRDQSQVNQVPLRRRS